MLYHNRSPLEWISRTQGVGSSQHCVKDPIGAHFRTEQIKLGHLSKVNQKKDCKQLQK